MGRGQPTSRTPNYTTELEVLLETKNERIAKLDGFITEYQKRELDFQDRIAELEAKLDAIESFCEKFTNAYPDWRDEYEALGDAK